MSIMTNKYGLFKYDTVNDGLQKFNINTALNDNWDKVDNAMSETDATLSETKTNIESLREGLTNGSVIASRAASDAEGNNLIQTYETKSNANTARNELSTNINTRINDLDSELKDLISNGDSTTLASAKSYTDTVKNNLDSELKDLITNGNSITLASAKSYTNTVKNDLLNGAGGAYDTLKELADLIDANTDAIDALEIVATSKVNATDFNNHANSVGNPHAVTAAQVGAPTVAEMNAAIAAIPTPDVSGQISTHNSNTAAHSDIRALIQALKPRITTVSLAAGSWSGSAAPFTQSVTVSGILADATKQVINVAPTATSANIEAISTAGVYATAQGTNTITFSAMNSKPTAAVSFIVQFQEAITI